MIGDSFEEPRKINFMVAKPRHNVGIIGAGAAGLSAAWLLGKHHNVTLMEKEARLGGHAHTAWIDESTSGVPVLSQQQCASGSSATLNNERALPIDTGFIVFNEDTYPNFVPWLNELGVESQPTDMSFAVSREAGAFEYAGGTLRGLFAQPANVLRPRFWLMLKDLVRFYRSAVRDGSPGKPMAATTTLGEFLDRGRYNDAFVQDHLLPFGAAIWSTSQANMLDYPVSAFVRFCDNHGLLKLSGRPQWRTVTGGSAQYVEQVERTLGQSAIAKDFDVTRVERNTDSVDVFDRHGAVKSFDQVVFACHADQALAMMNDPSTLESELLGAFSYTANAACLHTDKSFMPQRHAAWSSWNYIEQNGDELTSLPGITYWMNRLQNLDTTTDYFVSLNPQREPLPEHVLRTSTYHHPIFNAETYAAQQRLWRLQGDRRSWFCGSYFGAGFHEDAIQSGLVVAEQLGGRDRPWQVEGASSRIFTRPEDSADVVAEVA